VSDEQIIHLRKAEEALAGAESEFAKGRESMSTHPSLLEGLNELDPPRQEAIVDLRDRISARYPTAEFALRHGIDDSDETYLRVTVDIDDPDEVLELVIDRLLELQLERGMHVYVLPIHSPEQTVHTMQQLPRFRYSSTELPLVAR